MRKNPYTPGAGFTPVYLAGRENLLNDAHVYLEGLLSNYPQQSIIYYGLRGVGKTVLLNAIEEIASNMNIMIEHIEASENGNFTQKLSRAIERSLRNLSGKEAAKGFVKWCSEKLKSFAVVYNTEEKTFKIEAGTDFTPSFGSYSDDLTDVFVDLGRALQKSGDAVCYFVDEVQYLSQQEIQGLIASIHRCNQLRLPIMIFCAGLPKILKFVGEAKSYSERLFKFEQVGALNYEESMAAIIEPAKELSVNYHPGAIKCIFEITEGYPYFIQELCSTLWKAGAGSDGSVISVDDVNNSKDLFFKNLDKGFFAVRYNRCTKLEKYFINAMVRSSDLPCNISAVASIMNRRTTSVSPIRGQLIDKGLIYSTAHGQIDFTVPQFDGFIKRINPELPISN